MIANTQIRQSKRAARRGITDADRQVFDQQIIQQIRSTFEYQAAHSIAVFRAFDGEVDLSVFCQQAWVDGKKLFLPVILGQQQPLQFAPWQADDQLIVAEFGIERPDVESSLWVDGMTLDLVLTPLVAFTNSLHRLGMGAGYYDRTFADKQISTDAGAHRESSPVAPILLGAAYECQRVSDMNVHAWDVPLDMMITEKQLRRSVSAVPGAIGQE